VGIAALERGVDPDLGQVGLVDLDLGGVAQALDEGLLGVDPLVAVELVADGLGGVVERAGQRLAPAGLLEHPEQPSPPSTTVDTSPVLASANAAVDHRRRHVLGRADR
jgi:hypothetical protein